MAEIKVAIKGDDSDLRAKFKESSAEARAWSEHLKEQVGGLKEGLADLAGESGFGGLKSVLTGLGAIAFGAALIDQFKEAAKSAIDFEKAVTSLSAALGPAFGGQAESLAKWIESISGAMGSFEQNIALFHDLIGAGFKIPEAKAALIDIQNGAKALGVSLEELGAKFVEIKGENKVPERMFREFPGLAALARGMVPGGDLAKATPEWMLGTLLPAIAPGGLNAPVRMAAQSTTAGQLEDLSENFKELSVELGKTLLPVFREFAGDLKLAMPAIKGFAEDLGKIMVGLRTHLGWLGADISANRVPGSRTIAAAYQGLFSTAPPDMAAHAALFKESAVALHNSANRLDASAQKIERAVNPK